MTALFKTRRPPIYREPPFEIRREDLIALRDKWASERLAKLAGSERMKTFESCADDLDFLLRGGKIVP